MPKKKQKSKSSHPESISGSHIEKILKRVQDDSKAFFKSFSKLTMRTQSLFIFGALFLGISLIWNLNQSIQLAFFTPHVTPIKKLHAIPIQLIIEKVGINLPIEETAINN